MQVRVWLLLLLLERCWGHSCETLGLDEPGRIPRQCVMLGLGQITFTMNNGHQRTTSFLLVERAAPRLGARNGAPEGMARIVEEAENPHLKSLSLSVHTENTNRKFWGSQQDAQ